jgi:hypothetical protein
MADSDADNLAMPMYKTRCINEVQGSCEISACRYLHQKQVDQFPSRDIAALPESRRLVRVGPPWSGGRNK